MKTMDLLQLIDLLKKPNEMKSYINNNYPELDIDYADIYVEKELSIHSPIIFLSNEANELGLYIKLNSKNFINLFPLHYLKEIFDDNYVDSMTDEEIANKIMNYRIHDA